MPRQCEPHIMEPWPLKQKDFYTRNNARDRRRQRGLPGAGATTPWIPPCPASARRIARSGAAGRSSAIIRSARPSKVCTCSRIPRRERPRASPRAAAPTAPSPATRCARRSPRRGSGRAGRSWLAGVVDGVLEHLEPDGRLAVGLARPVRVVMQGHEALGMRHQA